MSRYNIVNTRTRKTVHTFDADGAEAAKDKMHMLGFKFAPGTTHRLFVEVSGQQEAA